VCECLCVYVHVCVSMYMCVYVCVFEPVCLSICECLCVYVHVCVSMYMCVYVCVFEPVCGAQMSGNKGRSCDSAHGLHSVLSPVLIQE